MDLAELEIPETVQVHLEFPNPKIGKLYDDKGNAMTIDLYSPASNIVVAYKHRLQREMSVKVGRKGLKGFADITPEERDKQEVERLHVFTASVNNVVFNGKKVTTETIKEIYADPRYGWICDQLKEKLGSWEDFLS